jgi:putative glycosyltransferase (TIGR04372 family)
VVTAPTYLQGVNPNVLQVVGPKFVHITTDNPIIPYVGLLNEGIKRMDMGIESKNGFVDTLLLDAILLWFMFKDALVAGKPRAIFKIPNSMKVKGEAWMKKAGMNPDTPIVLLHARDIGYLPQLSHHGHRCVDINNYRLAIQVLLDKGYQVVRIGDKSNSPLRGYSKNVVDLPFHPLYDQFLDIYFSAKCIFAVNQSSGPMHLIRGFGKPALMVNRVVDWDLQPPQEVLVFKHYRYKSSGKKLSYQEILESGLGELTMDSQFEDAGVYLEENTPEELKVAVEEFIDAQEGNRNFSFKTQTRFIELSQEHEKRINSNPNKKPYQDKVFGFAYSGPNIAESVLRTNKGFLD